MTVSLRVAVPYSDWLQSSLLASYGMSTLCLLQDCYFGASDVYANAMLCYAQMHCALHQCTS